MTITITLAKLIANICNLICISTLQKTLTRKSIQKPKTLEYAFIAEICISETVKTISNMIFTFIAKQNIEKSVIFSGC